MNINFNPGKPPQNLLVRILTVIVGALALGLTLMFSLVVFAVIAVAGLVFALVFWWKTRAIREQMRAQMNEQMRQQQGEAKREPAGFESGASGEIIEGEAVRVVEVDRIESTKTSNESR